MTEIHFFLLREKAAHTIHHLQEEIVKFCEVERILPIFYFLHAFRVIIILDYFAEFSVMRYSILYSLLLWIHHPVFFLIESF